MRQAVLAGSGGVEWCDAPEPMIQGPGEALVRPVVVGRCDLDVAFARGLVPMPFGSPIGHEIIAEVVEAGPQAGPFIPGQRVFVPAQISCGTCGACRRGLTGRCESVPFGASYGMGREGDHGGGLSDLLRVPFARAMLTPIPSGADPVALIGAADMAADAWRAVGPQLSRHPEARLLVIGGMPPVIGLYAAGLGAALGAARVDYLDADEQRGRIAESYGATWLRDAPRGTYDVIVVAHPACASLALAFASAAPGGVITSVAPAIDGSPVLDLPELYHRGVTWTIGRPDCRHGHDGTLDCWANHGFRPDRVPATIVRWEEAAEAWTSDALYVVAVRH